MKQHIQSLLSKIRHYISLVQGSLTHKQSHGSLVLDILHESLANRVIFALVSAQDPYPIFVRSRRTTAVTNDHSAVHVVSRRRDPIKKTAIDKLIMRIGATLIGPIVGQGLTDGLPGLQVVSATVKRTR